MVAEIADPGDVIGGVVLSLHGSSRFLGITRSSIALHSSAIRNSSFADAPVNRPRQC